MEFIPLIVDIARAIGTNEALFLAKLSRLLENLQGKVDDQGQKWVRMTFDEWQQELPMDKRTIKRIVARLAADGYIETRTWRNRSLWYRIMYSDKLSLYDSCKVTTCHHTGGSIVTICHFDSDNLSPFLYSFPKYKNNNGKVEDKTPMETKDLQTLHNAFLDATQKIAPSVTELKSWYQFYADILTEAGDVETASAAIVAAVHFADGNNPHRKTYPIIDPGSIVKPAGQWIAAQKREARREREVNQKMADLPDQRAPELSPDEKVFNDFQQLAALYIQPAQFYLQSIKPAALVSRENGTLKIGLTPRALDVVTHRHARTIDRIVASMPDVESIEFIEV